METIHDPIKVTDPRRLNDGLEQLKSRVRQNHVINPGEAVEKLRHSTDIRHVDVDATQENLTNVEKAIKALELFESHYPETRFLFTVHDKTGKIQVRLVNKNTGEVVEEIPSSKLLDYAARMRELTGLVLEERA